MNKEMLFMKIKPTLFILILLGLVEILISLYLIHWRESFWNAISDKNSHEFITNILIFLSVAFIACFTSSLSTYCVTKASIIWRCSLNRKALNNVDKHSDNVLNINQRIQEDCKEYPRLYLLLIFNIIKSTTYVIIFTSLFIYNYNYYIICGLFIYIISYTLLSRHVAKPLISLNYKSQQAEAIYRQSMDTFNFTACIYLLFGVAKFEKKLSYFQTFFNQFNVIIPLLFMSSQYFTTSMTLGVLINANSILNEIISNMSYVINNYQLINLCLASKQRLKEIGVV